MVKPFKFKEFTIHQDKAAMKIGTDAVLLGAWCPLKNNPKSILDIGTGTGVIALMLAQRSDADTIDGVEIDAISYEQTVENFEESSWGDRLFCYHTDIENFADEMAAEGEKYDCIVSNPPFYKEDYKTTDEARNKARFNSYLPFENLLESVRKLLAKDGLFSVIIPFTEEQNFIALAFKNKLFLTHICRVKGNPSSEIKRSLLSFSFHQKEIKKEELVIEKLRHQYTKEYITLTQDFYLNM